MPPELQNQVRLARTRLGVSQQELASRVGISRQALSAIEGGKQVPSTAIALRLGHALGQSVEELFSIDGELVADVIASAAIKQGQRVALGRVASRWLAYPLGPTGSAAADGLVTRVRADVATVRPIRPTAAFDSTVFIAGCAPLLAQLGDRIAAPGARHRVCWVHASSTAALGMLAREEIHIAGAHLADLDALVARSEAKCDVVNLVGWQQGIVVAAGNPLAIRNAADLERPDVRVVHREEGSGASKLLERFAPGLAASQRATVYSHAEVADAIRFGAADAGIAIEAVAQARGLDFLPLAEERFDLVLPRELMRHETILRLVDTLDDRGFRADVGALGGYDTSSTGHVREVAS